MEGYRHYLQVKGRSENTICSYVFAVQQLLSKVSTLSDQALLEHKDWLVATYAAKTANNRLIAILLDTRASVFRESKFNRNHFSTTLLVTPSTKP